MKRNYTRNEKAQRVSLLLEILIAIGAVILLLWSVQINVAARRAVEEAQDFCDTYGIEEATADVSQPDAEQYSDMVRILRAGGAD